MHAWHPLVSRSLWLGVGAVAILTAGCAGMVHNNTAKAPIALNGSQEVPSVSTSATGSSDISVYEAKCPSALSSDNCRTLTGTVVTSGINGTAAHVHQGAAGQNGPVIVTLVKVDERTWAVPTGTTLSRDQSDAFYAGQLYVNVHSDTNKGGEIRAQLQP